MAEIVRMPKMSDTMEEGVIAVWHKKVGDTVESGELMAEVETDKATMDYESYHDGTVLYLGAEEGSAVKVNGILAIVGEPNESYTDLLSDAPVSSEVETAPVPEAVESATPVEASPAVAVDVSSVNAEIVRMPKMSDTMEEGIISSWHKKVGETVESGELMAEIDTDKATMEYESYNDGTVLYLGAEAGGAVKVDGILAIVGEAGADYKLLLEAQSQAAPVVAEETSATEAPVTETKETTTIAAVQPNVTAPVANSSNGRIKASPLAKKLASEKGIELSQVQGSADGGRIVKRDIENYVPVAQTAQTSSQPAIALPSSVGEESFEEIRVSQMRKTIAKRLGESKFSAPHFYLTMEINMDKAMEARKSMNEISPVKISFNDMVIKAAAAALKQHPQVNSSWLGDTIRINHHVHIGVAVAVEEGLLVPVVRFADNKSLSVISAEVKDLGGKAKNKELQPADWEGNTFTISNLGMFGIEEFTAIINSPDACILAVGGIKETAIVKDGQLAVGNIMKVTLSCDHRVVDGVVGSSFLKTFKGLMEDPVRILV